MGSHTKKSKLCLLIAAHNEELVLGKTISAALHAGMDRQNVYVVDDNSTDRTSAIAISLIPKSNVIKVGRSGKGLAITRGIEWFELTKRYRWIHIADADGAFSPGYFTTFRRELRVENAAATGYIRSLPGHRISEYRVFEYTVGMELHRRFQSIVGVIPIIPGPTSCFRSDVLEKLDFANKSITEDFDVTLQLHRNKYGPIQFIPEAIAYTQDPRTLRDFIRQITRWNRGVLQGIVKYRVGRRANRIDAYLSFQLLQNLLFFFNYFIWIPYASATRYGISLIAMTFLFDVLLTFMIALMVATKTRRWDIISAFPFVYFIRWINLLVFLKSFVEVILLRRFRASTGIFQSGGERRYNVES
jgi:cellulose synthase/poly-beta-1,6-N-acetylglucosamine synthase-like glycosyltransferase